MHIAPPNSLKGDIFGGYVLTVLSLPSGIALGALVFSPLGGDYLAIGVVAGVLAIAVTNLIGAYAGSNSIMTYGPYPLAVLMLSAVTTEILQKSAVSGSAHPGATAMALLLITMLLAGCAQLLMGLLRIGALTRYVPFPVVAGMMNGAAILIALSQIPPLFGFPPETSLVECAANLPLFQPLTLLVGLVTFIAILYGAKITTRVPADVLGMLCGTALYYALSAAGHAALLGPLTGEIPSVVPLPQYAPTIAAALVNPALGRAIIELAPLAVSIAFVITLRTLLGVVAVDHITQERSDANRELLGQGLANIVVPFFGGISVAGYSGIQILAYQGGARTKRVRLVVSLLTFLVLICLGPVVGRIPKVVLAGTLMAASVVMLDAWSLDLLKRCLSKTHWNWRVAFDLMLVLLVTGTIVGFGIFAGVGIGILLSSVLFVFRMSKMAIRRQYNAVRMRSNVERRLDEIRLLEEHGHRIHVFELEGFLFFGTTDKLADEIEQVLSQEGDYVILDFRRVSDIDSTGAKMLVQLHNRIRKLGKTLILSSVNTAELANELGILTSIGQDRCFASIDEALGWAEDRLLDGLLGAERYCRKLDLTHVDALRHFSANDFKILLSYCQEVACDDGEILFYQDDPSEDVYIIVQGRANLFLSGGDEKGLERRLATLCPGTFCGEMAILDNRPRSATVVAEGTLICHKLSVAKLHELYEAHPEVAYNLLKGLGQELAKRIRIANRLNTELRT